LSAAKVSLEPEGINESVHMALKLRTLREKFEDIVGKIECVAVQYQKSKRIAIYFGDYLLYKAIESTSDYKKVISLLGTSSGGCSID